MDFESSALPIGLVMFVITVGGALRKKAGHVVARAQYPKLAQELGLTHRSSRYASGVGKLTGRIDGYEVTVDPDDQRQIRVAFQNPVAVELWSHVHNRRPPPGMHSFRPANATLAALFRTAHGSPRLVARLDGARGLEPLAAHLKRMRELKSLSVTERGVTAVLDFGSPPYIPADVVRALVPRLLELARAVDEPMSSPSVPRDAPRFPKTSSDTENRHKESE